jgi:enoyl-CoA hydratase
MLDAARRSSYSHITYETTADRLAVVSLNRQHVRNAVSRGMTYELDAAFARACNDPQVRVIVLRSEGKHFCSGHDLGSEVGLRELGAPPAYEPGVGGDFEKWSELDVEMCLRWRDLRKPLVAGVKGYCIYHGVAIASCADVGEQLRKLLARVIARAPAWHCRCRRSLILPPPPSE